MPLCSGARGRRPGGRALLAAAAAAVLLQRREPVRCGGGLSPPLPCSSLAGAVPQASPLRRARFCAAVLAGGLVRRPLGARWLRSGWLQSSSCLGARSICAARCRRLRVASAADRILWVPRPLETTAGILEAAVSEAAVLEAAARLEAAAPAPMAVEATAAAATVEAPAPAATATPPWRQSIHSSAK